MTTYIVVPRYRGFSVMQGEDGKVAVMAGVLDSETTSEELIDGYKFFEEIAGGRYERMTDDAETEQFAIKTKGLGNIWYRPVTSSRREEVDS